MTTYEFSAQIKRLAAISSEFISSEADKTQTPLGAELWRRFSRLDLQLWERTITWIVEHHKTRFAPVFNEFVAAFDAVKPTSSTSSTSQEMMSIEHRLDWMLSEAERMGPKGAAYALDQVELLNIQMPPEIMEILSAKASSYEESLPVLSVAPTADGAITPPPIEDDEPPPEDV